MLFETLDEISVPIAEVFAAVTAGRAIERFAAKRGLILRRVDLAGGPGLGAILVHILSVSWGDPAGFGRCDKVRAGPPAVFSNPSSGFDHRVYHPVYSAFRVPDQTVF